MMTTTSSNVASDDAANLTLEKLRDVVGQITALSDGLGDAWGQLADKLKMNTEIDFLFVSEADFPASDIFLPKLPTWVRVSRIVRSGRCIVMPSKFLQL